MSWRGTAQCPVGGIYCLLDHYMYSSDSVYILAIRICSICTCSFSETQTHHAYRYREAYNCSSQPRSYNAIFSWACESTCIYYDSRSGDTLSTAPIFQACLWRRVIFHDEKIPIFKMTIPSNPIIKVMASSHTSQYH